MGWVWTMHQFVRDRFPPAAYKGWCIDKRTMGFDDVHARAASCAQWHRSWLNCWAILQGQIVWRMFVVNIGLLGISGYMVLSEMVMDWWVAEWRLQGWRPLPLSPSKVSSNYSEASKCLQEASKRSMINYPDIGARLDTISRIEEETVYICIYDTSRQFFFSYITI